MRRRCAGRLVFVTLVGGVLGLPPLGCTAFTRDDETPAAPADGGREAGPLDPGAMVADGGALLDGAIVLDGAPLSEEVLHLPLDAPGACALLTTFGGAGATPIPTAFLGPGCRVCVSTATARFGITVGFDAPGKAKLALSAQVRLSPGAVSPSAFAAFLVGPSDGPPAPPIGDLANVWTPATATRTTVDPAQYSAALVASAPLMDPGSQTCFDVDEIVVRALP